MGSKFITLILLLFASTIFAAESVNRLDVGDKTYHNVRWGTVNKGQVIIFHNQGVVAIPLADLPPEYQAKFGYRPPPPPPESNMPVEITNSSSNRTVRSYTGFLRQVVLETAGEAPRKLWSLELAENKEGSHVPAPIQQRPGLWKATGETYLLPNYQPPSPLPTTVITVRGIAVDRIANYPTLQVVK
jgi:hypothetical protein